jgi:hypothetical protein
MLLGIQMNVMSLRGGKDELENVMKVLNKNISWEAIEDTVDLREKRKFRSIM